MCSRAFATRVLWTPSNCPRFDAEIFELTNILIKVREEQPLGKTTRGSVMKFTMRIISSINYISNLDHWWIKK